jgi:uncharacterized protein (TIGR03086 family)
MKVTTQADAEAMAPRLYETAVTNTRKYLAAVTPDQWGAPTPCTDWEVTQLVTHFVSGALNAKSIMDGNGPQNQGDNVLGDNALAAFDAAAAAAIAAFNKPGAMERTVTTRRGEQVAGEYAVGQAQEILVHGWDLAKAIGQDTTLPADVVEVEYARAMRSRERIRGTGVFGLAEGQVSASADLQSQYLAILGRTA